jgi:trimethylamine--corrinoid protein Co-methyltransferase
MAAKFVWGLGKALISAGQDLSREHPMATSSERYELLSPEDVNEIDRAGRGILERVGIRILDSTYLDLLGKAGARVDNKAQRARFEGEWLDEALSKAPRLFTLCSRDGENDIELGGGKVFFANGGRVFRILDMGTGGYRLTLLRDVAHTAALVDHLDHLGFYIIACQAHDAAPNVYHLNDFYHAFNHTTKHVMGGCDTFEGVRQMWELSSLIAGGEEKLRERPFVSVITNPISPLTVEATTLQMLHFCSTHGIPVTCAPAPISGVTAPATLAGTLSQMHAEALAGVALVQIFAPGAKVLYGAVPTAMDLRTMEYTMGSVEMAMMNASAVQLARRYRLPIYASAGVTESKRPDVQAGVEKAFSSLMVAMAGADCIHLAAGMLDSGNSISYEQYAIDNEIIGMIHRVLAGIRVNEDTLGLEVIERIGPGGNYVLEDHTVEHMMREFFYPSLGVRHSFDIWEQRGRPSMLSRARELVEGILADGEEGLLDQELIAEIHKDFPGIQNI